MPLQIGDATPIAWTHTHQWRIRILGIKIVPDRSGARKTGTIFELQYWYRTVGIQSYKFLLEVLTRTKVNFDGLDLNAFFSNKNSGAARRWRSLTIIKSHSFTSMKIASYIPLVVTSGARVGGFGRPIYSSFRIADACIVVPLSACVRLLNF
jgi:hypothetical protein